MTYEERLRALSETASNHSSTRGTIRQAALNLAEQLFYVMDQTLALRETEGFKGEVGTAVQNKLTQLGNRAAAAHEKLSLMDPGIGRGVTAIYAARSAYNNLPSTSLTHSQSRQLWSMEEHGTTWQGMDTAQARAHFEGLNAQAREDAAREALERFDEEIRVAAGQLPAEQPPAGAHQGPSSGGRPASAMPGASGIAPGGHGAPLSIGVPGGGGGGGSAIIPGGGTTPGTNPGGTNPGVGPVENLPAPGPDGGRPPIGIGPQLPGVTPDAPLTTLPGGGPGVGGWTPGGSVGGGAGGAGGIGLGLGGAAVGAIGAARLGGAGGVGGIGGFFGGAAGRGSAAGPVRGGAAGGRAFGLVPPAQGAPGAAGARGGAAGARGAAGGRMAGGMVPGQTAQGGRGGAAGARGGATGARGGAAGGRVAGGMVPGQTAQSGRGAGAGSARGAAGMVPGALGSKDDRRERREGQELYAYELEDEAPILDAGELGGAGGRGGDQEKDELGW